MKKAVKMSLTIMALALVACLLGLVWFISRPDEQGAATVSNTPQGQTFEVNVEKPRMDRFLGGILPIRIEAKLMGGSPLRFDHASPGARIGSVEQHRLDLGADGWELLVETDAQGVVTPGTRLVFPIEIAERQWTLRCRPADRAVGYLHAAPRASSGEFDGSFLVELARCEDAKTGKILDTEAGGNRGDAWPSSPLTLRGRFAGLPPVRR